MQNLDAQSLIKIWTISSSRLGSDKLDVYFEELSQIFADIGTQSISVLEIGVQRGGNLEFFKSILDDNSTIVGIDINDPSRELLDGIHFYKTDSTSSKAVEIAKHHAPYDLIIEDASHFQNQVTRNIDLYAPLLRVGGYMMIEDLQYAYLTGWKRGLRGRKSLPNRISRKYFKNLLFGGDVANNYYNINLRPYSVILKKVDYRSPFRMNSATATSIEMLKPSIIEHFAKVVYLVWETKSPKFLYFCISGIRSLSPKLRKKLSAD